MFMRAGFNARLRRSRIVAQLFYRGGWYRAELVKFECGDYAWYIRGFFVWPEFVQLVRQLVVNVDGACSRIPERSTVPLGATSGGIHDRV